MPHGHWEEDRNIVLVGLVSRILAARLSPSSSSFGELDIVFCIGDVYNLSVILKKISSKFYLGFPSPHYVQYSVADYDSFSVKDCST